MDFTRSRISDNKFTGFYFLKKDNACSGAFTLIEALITLSLVVVVGLAIFASLNSGITIWQRVNSTYVEEDVSIFFEKISQDLRNSFIYRGMMFAGGKEEVSFPTIVVTRGSVPGLAMGPGEVIYRYNPKEKTLSLEKRNLHYIFTQKHGVVQELLKDIQFFSCSYYYFDSVDKKYAWTGEWLRDQLPLAVRINLKIVYDRRQYAFVKTISLPSAQ